MLFCIIHKISKARAYNNNMMVNRFVQICTINGRITLM